MHLLLLVVYHLNINNTYIKSVKIIIVIVITIYGLKINNQSIKNKCIYYYY